MAHLSSISAAMFTDLSFTKLAVASTIDSEAEFNAAFAASAFERVPNVRSFPSIGTPANIVKVPVFGQVMSSSIRGQADAPQLEVQINYVPSEWESLKTYLTDGLSRGFRMVLLATDVTGSRASVAGGFAPSENSIYYWRGKLESMMVAPSLSDATVATLSMSIQSDFYGPFTLANT